MLILDDDPILVEALRDFLREEGYAVEGYTDPPRALDRLRHGEQPDVMLLDYLMPGMNGAQFLEQMAAAGIVVPTVLFTAMNESRIDAERLPVAQVIKKPFDLDGLLSTLARI